MTEILLTPNFSLGELTHTDVAAFQEQNRLVTHEQIDKLTEVAKLLEQVRALWGCPIKVHSGYRCLMLNDFVKSTIRSQHLLAEAADFSPIGMDLGEAFRALWKAVKDGKIKVGQLIYETANRPYGLTSWIHISLGAPWRQAERCAQVLRMEHGKYTALA